jgi:hypothetical protein
MSETEYIIFCMCTFVIVSIPAVVLLYKTYTGKWMKEYRANRKHYKRSHEN